LRLKHEHRMDEANFKQTVFDKRYDIYETVLAFIGKGLSGTPLTGEDRAAFRIALNKSRFLFDEPIKLYLHELYRNVTRLEFCHKRESKAEGKELEDILEREHQIMSWLETEVEQAEKRFKPYMHL
jgi:hypothetical protein